MATVVLTTLGRAVGGPIGSAIGGLAGRTIDGAVFGSRTREGPRLRELQVQTSSYGSAIPKLFGTMRVAGTVIWATDLREAAASGGSKATGRTTGYSYSASFAVALSARPIRGVRRIWAEGKLLRGAAGDWKTRTGFRLYPGDEAQMPDPLIESVVGIGNAPAHRGIAYAVFEDLALADFGNRIPSLTFEVEADAGPLAVGAVIEALGDGAVRAADAGPMLGGYAAEGESVRAAIEALRAPLGGWFAQEAGRLVLHLGEGPTRALPAPSDTTAVWKRPPLAPADVTIAYHEAARDYQLAVQQVRERGARIAERIALPAVLDPAVAAGIAGDAARRRGLGGMVRTLGFDWRGIDVAPGTRVTLRDAPGVWRVRRSTIEAGGVTIELVPVAPATLPPAAARGSARLAADRMAGATRLVLVELPGDGAGDAVPGVFAVAAGTGAGWRRATLLAGDAALGLRDHGASAAPGIVGRAAGVLSGGTTTLIDDLATVEVVLLHDGMTLAGADDAALDRGANAARIGDEIVQFGAARRIAPARWRLSRLWRGRRGTEWAVAGHRAGDPFVLLDPATLRRIADPSPAVGRAIAVQAVGIASDDVAEATIVPDGRGIVPPAPVHGRVTAAGGRLTLHWVRRGRIDAGWSDATDVPLGEEREAWQVTLTTADGVATRFESDTAQLAVARPAQAAVIAIRQIGTHGASRPLILSLPPEIPA